MLKKNRYVSKLGMHTPVNDCATTAAMRRYGAAGKFGAHELPYARLVTRAATIVSGSGGFHGQGILCSVVGKSSPRWPSELQLPDQVSCD